MFNIVRCDSYDEKKISKALKELVDLKQFIKKGDKVLIKPNFLIASKPEALVTTHPLVVKCIIKELDKIGAKAVIADSPGGPYINNSLESIYKECGYINLPDEVKVELNYDTTTFIKKNPKGFIKYYKLIGVLDKVDKVISVPKIKTHMLTTLTCSVKNLFGLIPGTEKVSFHGRFRKVEDFCRMLADLAVLAKPTITIVDAVTGMEGEGPSAGAAKKVGLLIAGDNVFETDYNVCKIIGMDYETVPYLKIAREKKLFEENDNDFKKYRTVFRKSHSSIVSKVWNVLPAFIKNLASNYWLEKPAINRKVCTGCGDCMRACPAKAIKIKDFKANIDYNKCVRCYCCHELCRYKAVDLKKGLF